jgi:branched-chain amino acid transport system permease protein
MRASLGAEYVSPDSFSMFVSISLLVGVVVGGVGTIVGALFAALFIQFVPNIADQLSKCPKHSH